MKIETAIERLQAMIDCNEKYEAFLAGEDDSDEELRDTELTLEALRMAVRALESKPRWIPCAERLPEMHEENDFGVKIKVSEPGLFCEKTGLHTCVHIGVCKEAFEETWWMTREWKTYKDVTAWMPLPEAYKEDRHDKDKTERLLNRKRAALSAGRGKRGAGTGGTQGTPDADKREPDAKDIHPGTCWPAGRSRRRVCESGRAAQSGGLGDCRAYSGRKRKPLDAAVRREKEQ